MVESVSWGLSFLRVSQSVVQKLETWVEAIQSAIAMGLINNKDFQIFDTYPFDETRPITSVEVSKQIAQGLEAWERQIVQKFLPENRSVLVVAAGGARELLGISELGHEVTGIEYGKLLCEATQQELASRGASLALNHAERFEISSNADHGSFDAVFIARKFLSHVHGRDQRIELLRSVRGVMNENAVLLFGFYSRDFDGIGFRMQAVIANFLRTIRGRRAERVEIGDHLDPEIPMYHQHSYWPQLQAELQEAGFECLEHELSWFGWAVAAPAKVSA